MEAGGERQGACDKFKLKQLGLQDCRATFRRRSVWIFMSRARASGLTCAQFEAQPVFAFTPARRKQDCDMSASSFLRLEVW